jgi:hypothetical protein
MAGMWRQHQHALGPIEYVQSRVHEQHQPSMPSQAMMEMLAVQKQADAMVRQTCGISDPGHSHTLVDLGHGHIAWSQPSDPTTYDPQPTPENATLASCFTKLREEYHKLLATVDGPFGYKRRLEELALENTKLAAENAMLRAHPPLAKVEGKPYRWNALTGRWEEGFAPVSDDPVSSPPHQGSRYDPVTNRTYGVTDTAPTPAAKPPIPLRALGGRAPQIGLRLP